MACNYFLKIKYFNFKMKQYFFLLIILLIQAGCKTPRPNQSLAIANGMFKVMILYPNGDDKTFDIDYYEKKHMPMVAGFIGSNLKFYEIDKGVAGRTPNDKAPFAAIGYFFIKDVTEYNNAIAKNRDAIVNDFKNYTNIQPVVQISEVKQVVSNNAVKGNTGE